MTDQEAEKTATSKGTKGKTSTIVLLIIGAMLVAFMVWRAKHPRKEESDSPEPTPSGGIVMSAITGCDDIPTCERECDAGQSDRCRRLAVSYAFGQGVDKNEVTATALYVKACGEGNASACLSAGQMYEYHHGVPEDDARAAGYYRAGCDLGYGAGCVNYGIMLENGRGVGKDVAAAKAIYDHACGQGAQVACAKRDAIKE